MLHRTPPAGPLSPRSLRGPQVRESFPRPPTRHCCRPRPRPAHDAASAPESRPCTTRSPDVCVWWSAAHGGSVFCTGCRWSPWLRVEDLVKGYGVVVQPTLSPIPVFHGSCSCPRLVALAGFRLGGCRGADAMPTSDAAFVSHLPRSPLQEPALSVRMLRSLSQAPFSSCTVDPPLSVYCVVYGAVQPPCARHGVHRCQRHGHDHTRPAGAAARDTTCRVPAHGHNTAPAAPVGRLTGGQWANTWPAVVRSRRQPSRVPSEGQSARLCELSRAQDSA